MRVLRVTVVTALLALLAVYFVLPLVWVFIATTKTGLQLVSMPMYSIPSHPVVWQNLRGLFGADNGIFWYWLGNSMGYSVIVGLVATYISGLAGFALAKLRFAGRRVFAAVIVGSLMVPSTVFVIPIFIFEARLHITNSYEGVILPQLFSGFAVFFMMTYLRETVPDALLDAAKVDGASLLRTFHRIVLPMSGPGLATLFLVTFVATWNNYFLPLILLTNQKIMPVTVGLSTQLGGSTATVTGIAVSVVPTLLLFPFLQRYVGQGILVNAVAD